MRVKTARSLNSHLAPKRPACPRGVSIERPVVSMTEYAAKDCKFLGQQLQSANVVGRNGTRRSLAASLIVATVAGGAFSAWAQHVDVVAGGNGPVLTVPRIIPLEELPPTIGTLKGVEPLKPDVRDYIVDRKIGRASCRERV